MPGFHIKWKFPEKLIRYQFYSSHYHYVNGGKGTYSSPVPAVNLCIHLNHDASVWRHPLLSLSSPMDPLHQSEEAALHPKYWGQYYSPHSQHKRTHICTETLCVATKQKRRFKRSIIWSTLKFQESSSCNIIVYISRATKGIINATMVPKVIVIVMWSSNDTHSHQD
jgi:hypothetical protein